MIITFPDDTADYIDAIRNAIGRDIQIDVPTLSGCSVCSLDPTTNTSTDAFCPVCHGSYWIPVFTSNTVKAHITWGNTDRLTWLTGGQIFDGDCLVQIKYSDANDLLVASGIYYHVDGKILVKDTAIYRGVPTINRILVNLKEKEK